MKLIALILGLGLERLATRLPHLRELRWLDPYFDIGMARLRGANTLIVYLGSVILLIVPAIPVYWASRTLIGTGILWDLPYLLFAVLGVFFCLGPRDLASEVEEYCEALASSDDAWAERVLKELCEVEHSEEDDLDAVKEAIFVQATNRFFGRSNVVFPHFRQNLGDASQASVPLLQKKTRSAKECSTSWRARWVEGIV